MPNFFRTNLAGCKNLKQFDPRGGVLSAVRWKKGAGWQKSPQWGGLLKNDCKRWIQQVKKSLCPNAETVIKMQQERHETA